MPVILAIQETEIRRITVQSQPQQIVLKALFQKTITKNWAGGVAQGEGPEFKPQNCREAEREREREKEKVIYNAHKYM
jgi:hypothetical protein